MIEPNLVIANVTESTIRGSRDQEKFALEAGWNLENYEAALPMEDKSGLVGKFVQLTVCVIVTEDSESLSAVLHSIRQQTFGDFEIILVLDEQVSVEMRSQLELFVAQDARLESVFYYGEGADVGMFWRDVLERIEGEVVFVNDRNALSLDYLEVLMASQVDTNVGSVCRAVTGSFALGGNEQIKDDAGWEDAEGLRTSCAALREELFLFSTEKVGHY